MLDLPLTPGTPWSVKIAADARLTTTDYGDDAGYALNAIDGPLGLTSSYGGRCAQMLWDLRWHRPDTGAVVHAVADYAAPPLLHDYGPAFALIETRPFPDLHAQIAYIAHTSHSAICRIELHNTADTPTPYVLTSGMRLRLHQSDAVTTDPVAEFRLEEATHGAFVYTVPLQLVLFWAEAGPYAAVSLPDGPVWTIAHDREITLAPDERRVLLFGLLTPQREEAAGTPLHGVAQAILATDWTAELARQRLASANIPQIETGDAAWDAAIACAYRMAARCYLSGSGDTRRYPEVPGPGGRAPDIHRSGVGYAPLPYASFVFTRIPERGYPPEGRPEEHSWQWNGQVATEAYVNLPGVAPFAPELGKAVLRNYLHIQQEDGFIDWKPGLAGQRAGWECMPLLATLTRIIYDYTGDLDFLQEVYPGLLRHLDRWFTPANDRNGDGFPEWTHTVQSAFDDNPGFVPWRAWSQGADLSKANSPDLGAYLYREHRELVAIARLLPEQRRLALNADIVRLTHRADQLRDMVEVLWSAEHGTYLYGDRDTLLSHPGEQIWETQGPGEWQHSHGAEGGNGKVISVTPPIPSPLSARRVVIRIEGAEAPQVSVLLQGEDAHEQALTEVLDRAAFGWWGGGVVSATSEGRFSGLSHIAVAGVTAQQRVRISFVDYTRQNQTQLLPLWAGIPDAARAEVLVRRTITDPERFWRAYGMPNCSAQDPAYAGNNVDGSGGVWMPWNTMIGEGLCDYGYVAEAWELFSRIMAAQVRALTQDHCFREAYDSDTGAGLGDADYIWGMVPLHLLTRLHGVLILSQDQVALQPADTLGRRIVIRRHGLMVERQGRQATITWLDGTRREYTIGDEAVVVTR